MGGQLALTAIVDGFLLDLAAGTLTRHVCYEPGGFPEYQEQRTNALGFDPSTGRLYAQPRTFDDPGTLLRSEVGMDAAHTGLDLHWWSLPNDLDAGGLIVTGPNQLVLGVGARLHRYDLTASRLTPLDDLTALRRHRHRRPRPRSRRQPPPRRRRQPRPADRDQPLSGAIAAP